MDKDCISYIRGGTNIYIIDKDDIMDYCIKKFDIEQALADNPDCLLLHDNDNDVLKDIEYSHQYIDIMPDSVLRDWFVDEFLMKRWNNVIETKSLNGIEKGLKEIIGSSSLHKKVAEYRISRVLKMFEKFTFTYNELCNIIKLPSFKEAVDRSIEIHCKDFIEKEKQEYDNELIEYKKNEKQRIEDELSVIYNEFDKTKVELEEKLCKLKKENVAVKQVFDEYVDKIDALKLTLDNLEKNRENVVNSFSVVKDVIQLISYQNNDVISTLSEKHSESIDFLKDETLEATDITTFKDRLKSYLEMNNCKSDLNRAVCGLFVWYKTVLLPDNRIALSIIKASGRCKYSIQYVTPDWRSFECVWNNGLKSIVQSCLEIPDIMHYYVLENCNLSYLPCYLQPVVDMIIGLRRCFPTTKIEFPKNLRLILIPTTDKGMPLSKQCIQYFGCLGKTDYMIEPKNEAKISNGKNSIACSGYLSPKLLDGMKEISCMCPTDYQSYLEDE